MTTVGLLLLPAVGGYWFLTHFNYTRFQSVRDSGYHVLFRSAVVGIVLYCIATGIAVAWRKEWSSAGINYLDEYSPDPFTTEVILSLALAVALPILFNFVYRSTLGVKRAARNTGEHIELVIIESIEYSQPIELSLKNRKVYIGWAVDSGVGSSPDADVAVVPMYSGYRDENTLDLHLTIDYEAVLIGHSAEGEPLIPEDFRVVLPMSKIVSARLFDEEVYDNFSMGRFDFRRPGRPRRRTRRPVVEEKEGVET